jgi:nitrate reductase NapE component
MSESRSRVLEWTLLAIVAWTTLTNLALALVGAGLAGWMFFSRF